MYDRLYASQVCDYVLSSIVYGYISFGKALEYSSVVDLISLV